MRLVTHEVEAAEEVEVEEAVAEGTKTVDLV